MRLLDFSKILLPGGGGPPPRLQRLMMTQPPTTATATTTDGHNNSSTPYGNDERYTIILKMRAMKMPEGAIRQKMMKDGQFTVAEIQQFFQPTADSSSGSSVSSGTTTSQGSLTNDKIETCKNDARYAHIIKLKNLKVPEIALRHRMVTDTADGFSSEEIDDFFAAFSSNNEQS